MKPMLFAALPLALLAFVPALGPAGGARCQAEQRWQGETLSHEIFFAVLEGLYEDGVSSEAVDAITAKDPEHGYPANFVWACPVCMPAYEAMLTYRARPRFDFKKGPQDFGPGLDEATMARLTTGEIAERQQAIMGLVERWLARRIEARRLTQVERDVWREEMAMRRKKGMSMLQSYQQQGMKGSYAKMKACPFCDGANKPLGR
jgi:hypothetical protein